MRIKGGTHSRRIKLGSPPQYTNYLGYAYAALGDYDSSADAFSQLISLAEGNAQYAEYIKGAKARILQYKSRISLYTDGGTPVYYGA